MNKNLKELLIKPTLIGILSTILISPQINPFLKNIITKDMYKAELRGMRSTRTNVPLDKEARNNQAYLESFCLNEGIDVEKIKEGYRKYAKNHSFLFKNYNVFK